MSTASPNPHADIDLDGLIQSLPACKRCRECRRGCDTLLPKCKQCTKAGVECIFYDHGRNEFLPRSYISELVDHVRRISAPSNPSPSASGDVGQDVMSTTMSTTSAMSTKTESVVSDAHPHYEHHFASAGNSYRYLGADSCLLLSPRPPAAAVHPQIEDDDDWQLSMNQSPAKSYELVEVYLDAVQPLYPIMDLSSRYLAPEPPPNLTAPELFNLNMIYSIACHVMPGTSRKTHPQHRWNPSGRLSYHIGNFTKYRHFAGIFLNRAMEHLEASTAEPTIDSLRAVLLLAINSLFDPKSGNIGQQVALAIRLALTLESQIEPQELGPKDVEMIRNMRSTIFSMENEIASTLDRPATFPEPEWELCFDENRPADYLCSLYRLQHRFRKSDPAARESIKKLLPLLDSKGQLIPGLRIALHQTHLLLNPCWGSAWYVLEAVVSSGSIHSFLTPHWVYRAGTILIKDISKVLPENLIQLYANALLVLELSSWKWPSSAALSASLADLMKTMKAEIAKEKPEWDGNLIHYDMRPGPAPPT